MFDRADVTYLYDGSFAGFLSCVFTSYMFKETPRAILETTSCTSTIFETKTIQTNISNAQRVQNSIIPKMGEHAAELLRRSFLSGLEQKELHMLTFMQLGYKMGPCVTNMLAHPAVDILVKAVKGLDCEAHKYKGFVRFSIHEGLMLSTISPKNNVLPYLAQHFKERFPRENFMIYDKVRKIAVMYHKGSLRYTYEFSFELPEHSSEERHYQDMWRLFHKTIAIKERDNPICQRSFMPKRYWEELTEMQPLTGKSYLTTKTTPALLKNS